MHDPTHAPARELLADLSDHTIAEKLAIVEALRVMRGERDDASLSLDITEDELRDEVARAFWCGVCGALASSIVDTADVLAEQLGGLAGAEACAESKRAAARVASNLRRAAGLP